MVWNPARASCLMVPGKSLAIMARTGHVWQPMGSPSGLAASSSAPAESTPATAAPVAEDLKNSLLEIAGMEVSSPAKMECHVFSQSAGLSHDLMSMNILSFVY